MIPARPTRSQVRTGVALAATALAVAGAVVALARVRPRRVVVEGRRWAPTLAPGDRRLVTRSRGVHAGDGVAGRDPRDARRVLVKRVAAVLDREVVLRGDNQGASTDSRDFGTVPLSAVLGRVVRRYAQAWRAGPVR